MGCSGTGLQRINMPSCTEGEGDGQDGKDGDELLLMKGEKLIMDDDDHHNHADGKVSTDAAENNQEGEKDEDNIRIVVLVMKVV